MFAWFIHARIVLQLGIIIGHINMLSHTQHKTSWSGLIGFPDAPMSIYVWSNFFGVRSALNWECVVLNCAHKRRARDRCLGRSAIESTYMFAVVVRENPLKTHNTRSAAVHTISNLLRAIADARIGCYTSCTTSSLGASQSNPSGRNQKPEHKHTQNHASPFGFKARKTFARGSHQTKQNAIKPARARCDT